MTISATRRNFCMASAALTFGFSTKAAAYSSDRKIEGFVRNVTTGAGIPNVRVSNGRDVCLSDAEGRYELHLAPHDIPFVIKPLGHRPLLNDYQLPKIHQTAPSGSDFFLEPYEEGETINAVLISDPQPGDRAELSYLSSYIERIRQTGHYDLAIVLGDLIGDNFKLYPEYDYVMSRLGVPVWNAPGNHDFDLTSDTPSVAKRMWRDRYGPGTRAFEIGLTSFIIIDNVGLRAEAKGGLSYFGSIGDENLRFVENYLKTLPLEQSFVLITHIPLACALNGNRPDCHTHDAAELLALFDGRNCVSFSGHMHAYEQHMIAVGSSFHNHKVLNALSGSWWSGPFTSDGLPVSQSCDGTPNGWYSLTIDKGQMDLQFIQARGGQPYRISLIDNSIENKKLLHDVIQPDQINTTCFQVNVFEGGPSTIVEAALNGRTHLNVSRVFDVDLHTCDLFARAGQTLKSWVQPVESTHIWQIEIPACLEHGAHHLVGRIIQPDNRIYEFEYSFRVA